MTAVAESFMVESRRRFLQALVDIRRNLRPRVLIADDNAVFARLLRDALDARDIVADIALDEGGVRMLIARHDDYDLLVLDGVCDPPPSDAVPVLYISGHDLARSCGGYEAQVAPRVGFRSKADGVQAIADEIAQRCGVAPVGARTVPEG